MDKGEISARDRAVYLTDEFIAHAQGQKAYRTMPGKVKQAIREFIGAIRNILRRAGLIETAEMSDSDLAILLRYIHKAARENGKATDTTMFMKSPSWSQSIGVKFHSEDALKDSSTRLVTDEDIVNESDDPAMFSRKEKASDLFSPDTAEAESFRKKLQSWSRLEGSARNSGNPWL